MPTSNGFTYAPILPGATVATRYTPSRNMTLSSDVSAIRRRDREGNKDISTLSKQEPHFEVEHAPKRRRISRAPEEISSNQVLQPTIEDVAPRRWTKRGMADQDYAQHLDGQLQETISYQELLPTIENAHNVRRSTRRITERNSTHHYNRHTGDNEEFTPRRASMSVILAPKRATSSTSESSKSPVSQPTSVSSQANDRFLETIHDQVFIHINAAMVRHKQTIDPKKLHEIGTSVASVLVDSPMFEHLNRYGLSREDENVISKKVKHYVDEFVAYSLGPATSFSNDVDAASTPGDNRKAKRTNNVSLPKRGSRSRTQPVQTELDSPSIDVQFLQDGSLPKTDSGKLATFKQVDRSDVHVEADLDIANMASSHETALFRLTIDGQPRPYIDARARERIRRGLQRVSEQEREVLVGRVYHIDFCEEELSIVRKFLKSQTQLRGKPSMALLMQKQILQVPELVSLLISQPCEDPSQSLIQSRGPESLAAFLRDAANGEVSMNSRTLMVGPKRSSRQFSALLGQREIHGMAPIRSCGGHKSYVREINSALEDSLQRKVEWTDCCGDIWAISWTSSDAFVCGATAHSDSHNMQYNKPGNLVVGSVSKETLDAMPDHRIARPIVNVRDNVENALDSMRQTQDPWIYTSISAISHSHNSGLTFTASFDGTVKVWKVSPSDTGSSMDILGTWPHEGKVNFVTTSEYHDFVATASDVYNNAVRIYRLDTKNISESTFHTYNGEKAAEQARELHDNNLWAYYPATVQWGRADSVSNLLLVGYSPRSFSNDEIDIPEDKRNSGELCLWNASDGSKVPIASARAQNVFEVVWHPTKPTFIAATSSYGLFKSEAKTQVRLFAARTDNDNYTAFYPIRVLDCPAMDINELTVM